MHSSMRDQIYYTAEKRLKATALLTHPLQERKLQFPNTLCRHTPAKKIH